MKPGGQGDRLLLSRRECLQQRPKVSEHTLEAQRAVREAAGVAGQAAREALVGTQHPQGGKDLVDVLHLQG